MGGDAMALLLQHCSQLQTLVAWGTHRCAAARLAARQSFLLPPFDATDPHISTGNNIKFGDPAADVAAALRNMPQLTHVNLACM